MGFVSVHFASGHQLVSTYRISPIPHFSTHHPSSLIHPHPFFSLTHDLHHPLSCHVTVIAVIDHTVPYCMMSMLSCYCCVEGVVLELVWLVCERCDIREKCRYDSDVREISQRVLKVMCPFLGFSLQRPMCVEIYERERNASSIDHISHRSSQVSQPVTPHATRPVVWRHGRNRRVRTY